MKKLPLAVGLIAALVGALLFLRADDSSATRPQTIDGAAIEPVSAATPATKPPVRLAVVGASAARSPVDPSDITPGDAEETAPARHPWQASLAGFTGRLLEADGTPATGLGVEALTIAATNFAAEPHRAVPQASSVVKGTPSASDGRFHIGGVRGFGLFALSIDAGGPRATMRFVEVSPDYGGITDLGDIVLPGIATVSGRVVDASGAGVGGARVRLAGLPAFIAGSGLLGVTEQSLVLLPGGQKDRILEFRPEFMQVLGHLPMSTATTAADGTFRTVGVPAGTVSGGVDRAGYAWSVIAEFTLRKEHDLGEILLGAGRTEHAVVRAGGAPIAGAEVRFGVAAEGMPFAVMQPGGTTDASGQASLAALPLKGVGFAMARRHPWSDWVVAESQPDSKPFQIDLPASGPLEVLLVDASGAPVEGAALYVRPGRLGDERNNSSNVEAIITGVPKAAGTVSPGPGRYLIEDAPYGYWTMTAKVPGYARTEASFRHQPDPERPFRLVCSDSFVARVVVVDAKTETPVENAHLSVMVPFDGHTTSEAAGWTDASGRTTLGPLADPNVQLGALATGDGVAQSKVAGTTLVVEHPDYARTAIGIDPWAAAKDEVRVSLHRPSTLEGRVHWAGAPPPGIYMIEANLTENGRKSLLNLTRTALTKPDGTFSLGGLSAGEYSVDVNERYLNVDPLELLNGSSRRAVTRIQVTLLPGEPLRVDIPLTEDGAISDGWIEGTVTLNGRPLMDARVKFEGNEDSSVSTDSSGGFRSSPIRPGSHVRIAVLDDIDFPGHGMAEGRLYSKNVDVLPGQATRMDIELRTYLTEVRVVDQETGHPLAGAVVHGNFKVPSVAPVTDADGAADVLALESRGKVQILATLEGYLSSSPMLDAADMTAGRVHEIRLLRMVPFGGHVALPANAPPDRPAEFYISLTRSQGPHAARLRYHPQKLQFWGGNLQPGSYFAIATGKDGAPVVVPFEQPPGGKKDHVFDFSQGD